MIRRHLFLFLLLLSQHFCFAQKPLPVPSYAREHKPITWYKEQQGAWAAQVQKTPGDLDAWYNYYKVNRILIFHDVDDKRSVAEKDRQLNELVEDMGAAHPGSYEYYFAKWQLGGNDMKYYHYLEKAIAKDPNRTEHIDYMINIGEIGGKRAQRDEYSIKKMKAGLLSSGMMYYNYNTLTGLKPNAILLTSGDNDTYPAWALQAMGNRPDVHVLNLYLLHIPEYRSRVFRDLGVDDPVFADKDAENDFFKNKLVQHLYKNRKNSPVYLALTTTSCKSDAIEGHMYLTGLAYQYDTNAMDNMAALKMNFEKNYALDYLDKPYYEEISSGLVQMINQNYIVPMLKLYEHYKESGDIQRQHWIGDKLKLVSRGSESEAEVLKYLD